MVAVQEAEVGTTAAIPAVVVEVPRPVSTLTVVTNPLKPPIIAVHLPRPPLLIHNWEAIDQLMKDLDLLHRQNMAPKPILEMSLGLARDVLNLHDRYEDLKPTFKTSEFCKATHETNLADFAKQKKQLVECREVQNRLGAGLSSKTKATFLVQSMVATSRPALEIAEASIHQGVLLQKELSIKKVNLQETLRKLGF
ncbi:unnamed protein product [Prunus armeniaca]